MIKLIARSSSRTLLPVLCTIAGLTTVGLGSIALRGETRASAPVLEAEVDTALYVQYEAPPVPPVIVHVRHRTEQHGASGSFSPRRVVVRRGDVVRFETDGLAAHNVSFGPEDNPGAAVLPPSGTYLTSPGQAYDVRIDLEPGVYRFRCDPHAPMGERGTLVVKESLDDPDPVGEIR